MLENGHTNNNSDFAKDIPNMFAQTLLRAPKLALPSGSNQCVEELDLLQFRQELIEFKIHSVRNGTGSSHELKSYFQYLASIVQICLKTAAYPPLSDTHRTVAIDVVSISLTRLVQFAKQNGNENLSEIFDKLPADLGNRMVDIVLSKYDNASAQFAKAIRDCFTNFLNEYDHLHLPISKQILATDIAKVVLGKEDDFREEKSDLLVLHLLLTRKWLQARDFLEGGDYKSRFQGFRFELPKIIERLSNRRLAPSTGRFISDLLVTLYREVLRTTDDISSGTRIWLDLFQKDIIHAMVSQGELISTSMALYVLPEVFKCSPDGFLLFLSAFMQDGNDEKSLVAYLAALKAGKEFGLVKEHKDHGLSTVYPLSELLKHRSWFVRVSALEMLVATKSPTDLIPKQHLALLYGCLDDTFANCDPELRIRLCNVHRVLLHRLRASSYALSIKTSKYQLVLNTSPKSENAKGGPTVEQVESNLEVMARLKDFCTWMLYTLLPSQLRLGSSYTRTILALDVYKLWVKIVGQNLYEGEGSLSLNKPKAKDKFRENTKREELIQFPFEIKLNTSQLERLLLERVMDSYEDVRDAAGEMLMFLYQSNTFNWNTIIMRANQTMLSSGQAGETDGIARLLKFIYLNALQSSSLSLIAYGHSIVAPVNSLSFLQWTLNILEVQADQFVAKLQENGPFVAHGLMGGMKYILNNQTFSDLSKDQNASLWKEVLERVPGIYLKLWSNVKSILCVESPEGFLHNTNNTQKSEGVDLFEVDGKTTARSRSLLSFSWRTVAVTSDLITVISSKAPDGHKSFRSFLLSMGNLAITQLCQIRHRGSLSSVHTALTAICSASHRSKDTDLRSFPQKLLEMLLQTMTNTGTLTTRRSAGLPMAVGAILAGVGINAKISQDSPTLRSTFHDLFQLARKMPNIEQNKAITDVVLFDLPQVHALNCLKFLYMDSKLSSSVENYVREGLEIALLSFSSDVWAIRNCGTMLFTSLLNRIFGLKVPTMKVHIKPSFSAKEFFEKYTGISQILLQNLELNLEGLRNNNTRSIESVYPILTLLSGLENTSIPYQPMEDFKVLILEYMSCRIWKIREMAATAFIASFVDDANLHIWLDICLNFHQGIIENRNNIIHGGICAAMKIIERLSAAPRLNHENRSKITKTLLNHGTHVMNVSRVSYINQALYLRLLHKYTETGIVEEVSPVLRLYAAIILQTDVLQDHFASALLVKEAASILAHHEPACALSFIHSGRVDISVGIARCIPSGYLPASTTFDHLVTLLFSSTDQHLKIEILHLLARVNATSNSFLSKILDLVEKSTSSDLRDASLAHIGYALGVGILSHKKFTDLEACETQGDELYHNFFHRWLRLILTCANAGSPVTSRYAGLVSIGKFCQYISSDIRCNKTDMELCMPLFFLLHSFLNDDDEDVREYAATISNTALKALNISRASSPQYNSLEMTRHFLTTLRELLRNLAIAKELSYVTNCQEIFLNLTFKHLLEVDLEHVPQVNQKIGDVIAESTSLFKVEKQNLYYDRPRMMELGMNLIVDILNDMFASNAIEEINTIPDALLSKFLVIRKYLEQGITALREFSISQGHGIEGSGQNDSKLPLDGILGWSTSNEETYVLGLQIAKIFRIWAVWLKHVSIHEIRSDDQRLIALICSFVTEGQQEEVMLNEEWLHDFRAGLNTLDLDGKGLIICA